MNITSLLLIVYMAIAGFKYKLPDSVTIVVDWFEVFGSAKIVELQGMKYETFADKELFVSERNGVHFTYTGRGTVTYKYAFECRLNGVLVGEIWSVPRFINENNSLDSISFKMANNLLYSQEWHKSYLEVVERLELKINNISRLDIAVDGCNDLIRFLNFYTIQRKSRNRVITRVGKAKFNEFDFDDKTLSNTAFTVGKRVSERYVIVYHKSKEIKKSNKVYITEYWKANGFDDVDNVIRCEIRLSNKYLEKIKGLTVDRLAHAESVTGICKKAMEGFFEFREVTGHANKSREREIELIPFSRMGFVHLEKTKLPIQEGRYKIKLQIHALAMQILREYVTGETKERFLETIKETVDLYSLHEWYEKKIPEWTAIYGKHSTKTGHTYELSFL